MRVLLVSSSSGSRGGGEIYLQRLALGLSLLGHEVHFVCNDHPRMDELAGQMTGLVHMHRLSLRNTYDRPMRLIGAISDREHIRQTKAAFKRLSPHVIHVNQQVVEDGLDLLMGAKRTGVPVVSTIHIVHSAHSLGARSGFLRDLISTRVLRRSGATYIVVAEQAGRALASRLELDPSNSRLHVVHNGVWQDDLEADETARQRVRREWGVGPGAIILGCVGRLEKQKDPLFLLEVLAELRKSFVPAHLVWIGSGTLSGQFEAKATALGLRDSVTLDGWRPDAARRMLGLDIFVMASRFEGLPLALLESMCAGLPCCVSDVDGIPEAVEHGANGFICAPADLGAWTSHLLRLAKEPTLRCKMGRRALEVAKSRFSLRGMAERTESVYRFAIDHHAVHKKVRSPP